MFLSHRVTIKQGPTTSAADQAHVAELKQHMADTSSAPAVSGRLSDIRDVDIDSGIYKYVLIKVCRSWLLCYACPPFDMRDRRDVAS